MPDVVMRTGVRATRREWVGLGVIALPCMLYSMDLTVLNLAVPHLSAALTPSSSQLLWIVDIYGFLLAGSLITMGTLGDRIGRRRLLLIGAVAFGSASVFAAFSTTAEMLIVARALLGIAAATLAPSTLSLIRNMFLDPKERTVAIGVWIASFSAGAAIGPLIGGVLLTYFWWGSVFLVAVPVMVALLVLGPIILPEYRDPEAGRLDILSAMLSLVAVLSVIYGIKRIAEYGLGWEAVFAIVFGLAVGAVFALRQRKLRNPLIDLRLFRSRAFSASLGVNVLGFFVAFGSFLFIAQYLQLVLGMEPFAAGLWTMLPAFAFIAGSTLTPIVVGQVQPAYMMVAGLALAMAGFLVLTRIGGQADLVVIVIGYSVFSLGLAPVFTLATDLIVGTVEPEQAGAASGIAETSSEFGGALGIAILGSIITTIYRSAMTGVGEITAAKDTLGAAVAVARELPGTLGSDLLDTAREAFIQAFQVTASICALVALAAAILAGILLQNVPTGSETPTEP